MTTAPKCQAKDPNTCVDPNCPEKKWRNEQFGSSAGLNAALNDIAPSPVLSISKDGTVDMKDVCVYCLEGTQFGSGKFVNRIPAGREFSEVLEEAEEDTVYTGKVESLFKGLKLSKIKELDGYMCEECYACDEPDTCFHEDCILNRS